MEDVRLAQLTKWLDSVLDHQPMNIRVASEDASFRRYFRVECQGETWIAMDAPPDKEDCKPFVDVATAFYAMQMNVPQIRAQDLSQGFLLLTDFGDVNFSDKLTPESADRLYGDAMQALLSLQTHPKPDDFVLPPYDETLLRREMDLFEDWYIEKHIQISLDANEKESLSLIYKILVDNALQQPQVCVHRDYHSRNLMLVESNNPGVIDFQDAVEGPITYDLVSLLRDCYIQWPVKKVEAWVADYLQQCQAHSLCENISNDEFLKWFDLMGLQRHLKVLGIFSRLNYRDGKSGYLNDIPLTLTYVEQVSEKYEELNFLNELISHRILPANTKP